MAKGRNAAVQNQGTTIAAGCAARDAGVGSGFVVTVVGIAAVTSTTCVARKSRTVRTALFQLV